MYENLSASGKGCYGASASHFTVQAELVDKVQLNDDTVLRRLKIDTVSSDIVQLCQQKLKEGGAVYRQVKALQNMARRADRMTVAQLEKEAEEEQHDYDDELSDSEAAQATPNVKKSRRERNMYEPLEAIFDAISSVPTGPDEAPGNRPKRCFRNQTEVSIPDQDHSLGYPRFIPDFSLLEDPSLRSSKLWSDRAGFIEVKASSQQRPEVDVEKRKVSRILTQVANYARLHLSARPFSVFSVSIMIFGCDFCVAIFDRGGAQVSPIYDMFRNPDTFIRVIRSVTRVLSDAELGRDPSGVAGALRTIAYQLACRYPAFCDALTKVIEADPDIRVSLPSQQLKELIVEPLKFAKAQQDFPSRIAVVIDALDECTDQEAVSTILKSLSLHISELTPLKFVITSRPEENITRGFILDTLRANTQQLSLAKVPRPVAQRDISIFLKRRLTDIRERYSLGPDWPPESQSNGLLGLADGLFIYAATAILFVRDDKVRDPDGQLLRLLEAGRSATVTEGEGSTPALRMLDTLYKQVLDRATEKLDESARARLKVVLGMATLAEERLSPTSIDALLRLPSGEVRRILPALNAVVHMPAVGDEHTPIRIIHLSFPNFLMDPSRCTSPEFLVNPPIHHTYIAMRCLQTLQSLEHNICGIASEHSHLFNVDIPGLPDRIAQHLPRRFNTPASTGCSTYAVLNWAKNS
ncbi:hypothetical protein BN946_scf184983.g47 [Trametes cinnabarina]|uniref:Uncharacterized protein n=1 Tax=Pycnoporus cinnabarinus TaxID=5643 RepID=A0A060SK01_PYCCI|nr:hypothetical protein BN946_scf184983.g47 [Trametes cinnabarina]